MCVVDNEVLAILREGVVIDAPFPRNMELAYELLIRENFDKKKDFLYISTQYENQYTKLSYNKTLKWMDDTGKEIFGKHFTMVVPDRYIPSQKGTQKNVIRTEDDIDNLFNSMSKKEES